MKPQEARCSKKDSYRVALVSLALTISTMGQMRSLVSSSVGYQTLYWMIISSCASYSSEETGYGPIPRYFASSAASVW